MNYHLEMSGSDLGIFTFLDGWRGSRCLGDQDNDKMYS